MDRAQLVSKLRGVIGDEETETLMAHLPQGGQELATKEFVRSEVELLRTEMRSGFAELRTPDARPRRDDAGRDALFRPAFLHVAPPAHSLRDCRVLRRWIVVVGAPSVGGPDAVPTKA